MQKTATMLELTCSISPDHRWLVPYTTHPPTRCPKCQAVFASAPVAAREVSLDRKQSKTP
jgi:hypothetical protein